MNALAERSKGEPATTNASWPMVPLGEIGRWFGGGTPSKSNPRYWSGGTIPWVSPKDMKQPLIDDAQDHITEQAVDESSTNMVETGSVLVVARSGILQHTLPVAITTRQVALNQDIKAVKPREGVSSEFLAMALKAFEREILHTCTKTGTTVQSLELPVFHRFQIPVPPLPEQRRIVAEIEKQFTRLDAGVAALRRTQANLKRYRAAVLKAACEGRLVPQKRLSSEVGAQLFDRINATRRSKWNGKGKYVEPAALEIADLPTLPPGWTWARFGHLGVDPFNTVQTGPFGAQLHNTEFTTSGVPVIAVGNLTGTGFKTAGLYFVTHAKAEQLARYDVWAGDLLFARSGATLGKVCVAPPDVQGCCTTNARSLFFLSPCARGAVLPRRSAG